ncbi:Lipopolysaccharide core heptose(II) kinase RfaY [Madurella mycetomatis]|uniref:Lipopolysaccharide core heptose(II) kinase RfaY n=1 Tax=Madurella mycetomatis TaxID=100816 RepID=A0A175WD87_9PEZI|nr:Lipopolysaccharide core heptose(II) kinase RfaY [Madurella mycetomatis]
MNVEDSQLPPPPVGKHEIELPKYKRPGEPEHYRLSATRLRGTKRQFPTTLVHFWFRTRYVSALAAGLSQLHPHILELHIRPSTVASLIGSCVGLLPGFAQSWVQAVLPEWFLPNHVVLKKQKEGEEEMIMEELFDTEVKAYGRLKPLQGVVIPTCYGRLHYNGTRALILEYLGGVSLSSPEGATLRLEELSTLLQPCYRALHAFGVHHDDPNLSNFQLVNGKIMVLDLESAVFDFSVDDQAFFMKTNIWDLAHRYRSMQAYYLRDGSLEAA